MLRPKKSNDWLFYTAIALALVIAVSAGYEIGAAKDNQNSNEYIPALFLSIRRFIHCLEYWFHTYAEDVIAAFTIILGIGTVGLAISTRRLANDAAETAMRELRAYVGVKTATIVKGMKVGGNPRVEIKIENYGKTPAYDFWCSGGMSYCEFPLESQFQPPPAIKPTIVLQPSATINKDGTDPDPITADQMESMANGSSAYYIWGNIFYTDAFGQPRTGEYLMYFGGDRPITEVSLAAYKTGNNAN